MSKGDKKWFQFHITSLVRKEPQVFEGQRGHGGGSQPTSCLLTLVAHPHTAWSHVHLVSLGFLPADLFTNISTWMHFHVWIQDYCTEFCNSSPRCCSMLPFLSSYLKTTKKKVLHCDSIHAMKLRIRTFVCLPVF